MAKVQELMNLEGQVSVVTGGATGIGLQMAKGLAEAGSNIVICSRRLDVCEQAAAEIEKLGVKALAIGCDVTKPDQVEAMKNEVLKTFGRVDVLVNNAGWDKAGNFLDTDKALWEKIVAINLYGPLYMHHAVLKGMAERGRGRVVNVASDAARVGSSGESVYSFCKGGLVAFTKTLARELAKKQINLNVVCPGPTDTPLLQSICGDSEFGQKLYEGFKRAIPFRRLGQPEDIPGAVAFLASDDAAFITGQVLSVSGGLTMAG